MMLIFKKPKLALDERNAILRSLDHIKSIHSDMDSACKLLVEIEKRQHTLTVHLLTQLENILTQISAMNRGQDAVLKNMAEFFKTQVEWTKKQIDIQKELEETEHDKRF